MTPQCGSGGQRNGCRLAFVVGGAVVAYDLDFHFREEGRDGPDQCQNGCRKDNRTAGDSANGERYIYRNVNVRLLDPSTLDRGFRGERFDLLFQPLTRDLDPLNPGLPGLLRAAFLARHVVILPLLVAQRLT